ncbi:hypothetical protein FS749_001669 [Ceratobasidium sp. UAMH 11750]|nr:hypothetical protein FS749_001669 [Ceratobasidium sp. UAMH 11750]
MHGRQLGWVCLASCGTDVPVNAIVLFWVTSSASNIVWSNPVPQPNTNVAIAIGHDLNQSSAPPAQRRAPSSPSQPDYHSLSAVMLSPVPHSPLTPDTPNLNLNEKKADGGFLNLSAWKSRFSMLLGKSRVLGDERRADMEMSLAPSPGVSSRRDVWEDHEQTSFMMANDRDLGEGHSGPGFVTIGVPPASRERTSTRTRVVNGVQVSQQQRPSMLGRIFRTGGTASREVTVTVTTQLDPMERMDRGSHASLDGTSTGGGGSAMSGKSEGGSAHGDLGAQKARV